MSRASLPKSDRVEAAPGDRRFITFWVDEDDQESVTFAEFRHRARMQASVLREHGAICGDRIVIIMPQGITAITVFAGAIMLGAVPAFLAYPNEKVEVAEVPLRANGRDVKPWRQARGDRSGISARDAGLYVAYRRGPVGSSGEEQ